MERAADSHQKLERHGKSYPREPAREAQTPSFCTDGTDIGLVASRRMRGHISVVLSKQIYGNLLLQKSQETNTRAIQ